MLMQNHFHQIESIGASADYFNRSVKDYGGNFHGTLIMHGVVC
jgi:hypothetical protein